MTISKTSIFKMACLHIKQKPINDPDEATIPAQYLSIFWDLALEATLQAHDWDFAHRRLTLAVHDDDPPDDWGYRYDFPADCIQPLSIAKEIRAHRSPIAFKVELSVDASEKTILTDQEDAILEYTRRVTNPAIFTAQFAEALSYRLAAYVALSVAGKADYEQKCLQAFAQSIRLASMFDARAGQSDEEPDSEFVTARN